MSVAFPVYSYASEVGEYPGAIRMLTVRGGLAAVPRWLPAPSRAVKQVSVAALRPGWQTSAVAVRPRFARVCEQAPFSTEDRVHSTAATLVVRMAALVPEALRETVREMVTAADAALVYIGDSSDCVTALAAAGHVDVLLVGGQTTLDTAAAVRRVRRNFTVGYVVAIHAGRGTRSDEHAADLLALGAAGVDGAVDLTALSGASVLQSWVARARRERFGARVVRQLIGALRTPTHDALSPSPVIAAWLFEAAFAREVRTARDLAARLGVPPTTLSTRLARSGLPTAKQFVEEAQLCWAAHWAEAPDRSAADVARALGEPSVQGLRRWVRRLTGLSFEQFRAAYDGKRAVDRYATRLVRPAAVTLLDLDRMFPAWCVLLAGPTV